METRRAKIEREARTLRERGHTMIEISQTLGVPASTLYRWAAENSWRGRDLAQAAWQEAYTTPSSTDEKSRAVGVGDTGTRSTRGCETSKEAEPMIPKRGWSGA
jgi:transposase-like protein